MDTKKGYSRDTRPVYFNKQYQPPPDTRAEKETDKEKTPVAAPCKPALSVHSTWAGSHAEPPKKPEQIPASSRSVSSALSVHSTWGSRAVNPIRYPQPKTEAPQQKSEDILRSQLPSQPVAIKTQAKPKPQAKSIPFYDFDSYIKAPTWVTAHSDCWYVRDADFAFKLTNMTLQELAQLARQAMDDSELMKNLEPFENKLRAYYSEIYRRLAHPVDSLSVEWFREILKVIQQGTFYNDALMARITQHIKQRVYISPRLAMPLTISLAKAIQPMILSGYYDPYFLELIGHYIKNIQYLQYENMNNTLTLVRTLCVLHVRSQLNRDEQDKLTHLVTTGIKHLNKNIQHTSLNKAMRFRLYWVQLYGRYALKLPITLSPPAVKETEFTSHFHDAAEQKLLHFLAGVPFKKEAWLPELKISVDFLLEPKVVVEVDGYYAHFAKELLLDGVDSSHQPRDRAFEHVGYREKGRTLIKRKVLQSAGYTVFNIVDLKKETIDTLISQLKALTLSVVSDTDTPVRSSS